MNSLYRDNILDHYKNPRNFGKMKKPDKTAEESNPLCGDKIEIQIKYKILYTKYNILEKITFTGEGCAISIASASMLTEKAKGKSMEDIKKLKTDDILKMLGITLTPTRLKCALLPLEVLQKALVSQ